MHYRTGLNIDKVVFNPHGECSAGGLYFTDESRRTLWYHCHTFFRMVIIPSDAQVYTERDKYKTDKFILSERTRIIEDEELCNAIVKDDNGQFLTYIHNQDLNVCLIAVKRDGYNLRYVKIQTPDICLAAVKENGCSLQFVHQQTPTICMTAVKQHGMSLCYVRKQTKDICITAVRENKEALRYVEDQYYEDCANEILTIIKGKK